MLFYYLLCCVHNLVHPGNIHAEYSRFSLILDYFLGHFLEFFLLNIHEDGFGAFLGKFQGDALADPLRSACHDGNFVLQNHLIPQLG